MSVVVDVCFPTSVVSAVTKACAVRFPLTPLRLFVEALGAAYQPVLDGRCSLGILPPLLQTFPSLLSKHRQLVLSDRSELTTGRDFSVAAARVCRGLVYQSVKGRMAAALSGLARQMRQRAGRNTTPAAG